MIGSEETCFKKFRTRYLG